MTKAERFNEISRQVVLPPTMIAISGLISQAANHKLFSLVIDLKDWGLSKKQVAQLCSDLIVDGFSVSYQGEKSLKSLKISWRYLNPPFYF